MFAPESEFGGDFFNTFLSVMKNGATLGTFKYHGNIEEMKVENIGDELKIKFSKGEDKQHSQGEDKQHCSVWELQNILQDPKKIVNLQ